MTPQQVIMPRRLSAGLRVFAAIVCALLLDAGDARDQATSAPARHINSQRLQVTLEKLSEFGRNPEGGVTRLGFSQTELDARTYVIGYEGCRARGSRRPEGMISSDSRRHQSFAAGIHVVGGLCQRRGSPLSLDSAARPALAARLRHPLDPRLPLYALGGRQRTTILSLIGQRARGTFATWFALTSCART